MGERAERVRVGDFPVAVTDWTNHVGCTWPFSFFSFLSFASWPFHWFNLSGVMGVFQRQTFLELPAWHVAATPGQSESGVAATIGGAGSSRPGFHLFRVKRRPNNRSRRGRSKAKAKAKAKRPKTEREKETTTFLSHGHDCRNPRPERTR